MNRLLPKWLFDFISKNYLLDYIYEIRIRINSPIMINYRGNYEVLAEKINFEKKIIYASCDLINYIMSVATKQSIYAYNDEIKHCYVQAGSGIRIGICGTIVYENGKILTIKNISSLCIRIAHEVVNCSKNIIDLICQNGFVKNSLIISPPGQGKTTLIRDIVQKLSNEKNINNILVVDERFEIAGGFPIELNVGKTTDVLSGAEKSFAFNEALKTMSPSVIVTDEISSRQDIDSVCNAIRSGVKVIASVHSKNISELKQKMYFSDIINNGYFERYITLSNRNGVGTIEGVFDENMKVLYFPYRLWRFC